MGADSQIDPPGRNLLANMSAGTLSARVGVCLDPSQTMIAKKYRGVFKGRK